MGRPLRCTRGIAEEAVEAKLHAGAGRRGEKRGRTRGECEVRGQVGKEGARDLTGAENHRDGHGLGDSSTEPAWARVSEDVGRLPKLAGWREGEGHKHCGEVASLRRGRGIHLSWETEDREGLSTCPLRYFLSPFLDPDKRAGAPGAPGTPKPHPPTPPATESLI